jgi:3-phosphoshikimate 1-carboxyvinyltransferase
MSPLPPVLPIRPFTQPAHGEVELPGSKSITNRALMLAALCDGPVTLTGALFSEDTEIMAEALNRLGIQVKTDPGAKTFQIAGQGGKMPAPAADLFVGNAGTAARFLTALCAAAQSGIYRLDGVPQMRKRPMKGLIDALRSLGADIRCPGEEGFFPLEIHARGLRGGQVEIDASESSQMLSALLMIGKLTSAGRIDFVLTKPVRTPFVRMTQLMMGSGTAQRPQFNLIPDNPLAAQSLFPTNQGGQDYPIEPDATAASYFMALPSVVGGGLDLLNLPLPDLGARAANLQMDGFNFIAAMNEVGVAAKPFLVDGKLAGISIVSDPHASRRGVGKNFNEFSDTFLTLAAIAALLDGPTTITGIAHTRKQETDRVAGMARELKKLGQGVVETEDSLAITPNLAEMKARAAGEPVVIETYGDHRFAMSFAILGCHNLFGDGRPWLAVRNPACCAKTFPNFFDVLAKVREDSHSNRPLSSLPQP